MPGCSVACVAARVWLVVTSVAVLMGLAETRQRAVDYLGFYPVTNLSRPRHDFGLIVLSNGSVLALAGDGGDSPGGQNTSNTTEIWANPSCDGRRSDCAVKWDPAAPLGTARIGLGATGLELNTTGPDGATRMGAIVAGGAPLNGAPMSTAEVMMVSGGGDVTWWTPTANMSSARIHFQLVAVVDRGRSIVLAIGGADETTVLQSVEAYDPETKAWASEGDMISQRQYHGATVLHNGTVLVAGGYTDDKENVIANAELFDPVSRTWTAVAPMTMPRYAMGLTTLPNGSVLAVGGQGGGGQTLCTAELFDPDNNTWTRIPMLSLASPRAGLGLATLPDGRVIAAGGATDSGAEAVESVELFGNFRPGPGGGGVDDVAAEQMVVAVGSVLTLVVIAGLVLLTRRCKGIGRPSLSANVGLNDDDDGRPTSTPWSSKKGKRERKLSEKSPMIVG